MSAALEIRDLTKSFRLGLRMRLVHALEGLTLDVDPGSIYGFVGPNGAGKSTTIKILVGLISATRGRASIFGREVGDPAARAAIGYLPENPSFHDFLRPRELLELMGKLSGMHGAPLRRRADEVLEQVGLGGARDLTVRKFSKGMVQRLGLAQAILHDPPLLILDEPMSGLDPIGRKEVRDLILDLRRRGKTVFFSTHILSDVETICDRVGMLLRGRLVAAGGLETLLDGSIRTVEVRAGGVPPELASALAPGGHPGKDADGIETFTYPDLASANAAAGRILAAGGQLHAVLPMRENLEQTFVRLAEADAAAATRERTGEA